MALQLLVSATYAVLFYERSFVQWVSKRMHALAWRIISFADSIHLVYSWEVALVRLTEAIEAKLSTSEKSYFLRIVGCVSPQTFE